MQIMVYKWVSFQFLKKMKEKKLGNFGQNLGLLEYEWVTFSWKVGICVGRISNSQRHVPTKTELELTPPPRTAIVYKGLLLLLSPLWQIPMWHEVAHAPAILN